MALTDTFVKQVKHTGKPAGDRYADGGNMYLLVKAAGKYWRQDYTHADKRKTLALGTYPEVSLLKARQRREKARELLADGIDPSAAKQEEKAAKQAEASNTFELVARDWLEKTKADRMASTQTKVTAWLEKDVFPYIGKMPISTIGPRDVLGALRYMEARGALDSVQRVPVQPDIGTQGASAMQGNPGGAGRDQEPASCPIREAGQHDDWAATNQQRDRNQPVRESAHRRGKYSQ